MDKISEKIVSKIKIEKTLNKLLINHNIIVILYPLHMFYLHECC